MIDSDAVRISAYHISELANLRMVGLVFCRVVVRVSPVFAAYVVTPHIVLLPT